MAGVLPPERQADKRAAAQLVKAAGGVEAAAELCRLGKSHLSDVGNVNSPDKFMPIDVVRQLEEVTQDLPGWPHVTRHLACAAGFELVRRPAAELGAETDWLAHIARVSKEAGDVVSKIAAHAAGGLSADEISRAELLQECRELVAAAVNIEAAVIAAQRGWREQRGTF
jgi:DUF1680 family protein